MMFRQNSVGALNKAAAKNPKYNLRLLDMKQDSCTKSYPAGVCPSPAGLPRRALSLTRSDGVCVSAAVLTTTLLVVRFRGSNHIDAPINLVLRSAHVILRRACPTWGARLEGLRASRRTATSETEPAAILARSVPTSAANGLKKSARSAALECYDAARKARCILMTAFSTFRGGAEHVCFRACYVPVWGAAEFAFCQPVQIDDEGSL
jgi:hypothetical protein